MCYKIMMKFTCPPQGTEVRLKYILRIFHDMVGLIELLNTQELGRARRELGKHAGSWESMREIERARGKLGEHGGCWESTREVGRACEKLREHAGS